MKLTNLIDVIQAKGWDAYKSQKTLRKVLAQKPVSNIKEDQRYILLPRGDDVSRLTFEMRQAGNNARIAYQDQMITAHIFTPNQTSLYVEGEKTVAVSIDSFANSLTSFENKPVEFLK